MELNGTQYYAWKAAGMGEFLFTTIIPELEVPTTVRLYLTEDTYQDIDGAIYSLKGPTITIGYPTDKSLILEGTYSGQRFELITVFPVTIEGTKYWPMWSLRTMNGYSLSDYSFIKNSGSYLIDLYRTKFMGLMNKQIASLIRTYYNYSIQYSVSISEDSHTMIYEATFDYGDGPESTIIELELDLEATEKYGHTAYRGSSEGQMIFLLPKETEPGIYEDCPEMIQIIGGDNYVYLEQDLYVLATVIDPGAIPEQQVTLEDSGKIMTGGRFTGIGNIKKLNIHEEMVYNLGPTATGNNTLREVQIYGMSIIPQTTFAYCFGLSSISSPDIKTISYAAFLSCTNLTTISFPKVTSIGSSAFEGCTNLTSVYLPKVTSIDSYAFYGCIIPRSQFNTGSLTSSNNWGATLWDKNVGGVLMDGATVIGANKDISVASIDYCTSISNYAFRSCSNLTTASFPEVTNIGEGAFYGCSNLTAVSFPRCIEIYWYAFYNCFNLTTVSFPECTSIGGDAFVYCTNLTTVSFPECTYIGYEAFWYCNKLSETYFTGSVVPSLYNSNVFYSTPIGNRVSSAAIYVAPSMVDAFKTANGWSYFSSIIKPYNP